MDAWAIGTIRMRLLSRETIRLDPEMSYWRRQWYFLSSLGIFYLIIIALFAIPLLGTFVVILMKGMFDLRYVIITGGCIGFIVLAIIAVRGVRRLRQRLSQDYRMAGRDIQRQLLLGNPFEVSAFNGMIKFSCGQQHAGSRPALEDSTRALLPNVSEAGRAGLSDIFAQLEHLSALRQSGVIDDEEFKVLKAMLIEGQTAAGNKETSGPA